MAPLQGFTTPLFQEIFKDCIGGVDKYFTPFFRVEDAMSFRQVVEKWIKTNAISKLMVVPQVIASSGSELVVAGEVLQQLGFEEFNLNIGCPFPMVMNRKMGAGMLPFPHLLEEMLDAFFATDQSIQLSVKTRLGRMDCVEFGEVWRVLTAYPLSELIMHPRTGIQQYKGVPDWDFFKANSRGFEGRMVLNGDINNVDGFVELKNKFPTVGHFMLGRGLLRNPFLALELQGGQFSGAEKSLILREFWSSYRLGIAARGMDVNQELNALKSFWFYLSSAFERGERLGKKINKQKKSGKVLELAVELLAGQIL